MNRPGIIFIFVALYSITAFAWWTFAHIKSANSLSLEKKNNLELLCYKGTSDVQGAIAQKLFNDTNDLKEYVAFNFPELEILFIDADKQINPMDYYLIRPLQSAYDTLEAERSKTVRMYALEGLVMALLLVWGVIWVFRSLNVRLALNRQQNNFMLSITHELKTPLASIKLYIETLLKRDLDKEQSTIILKNSLSETVRLKDLVNNILTAAQLENHKYKLHLTEINFSQIAQDTFDKFVTPRALEEYFTAEIEDEVYIEGDAVGVETIIINLLTNAYKYAGHDGRCHVLLRQLKDRVILSISDNGPGINDATKKKLYRRFYRSGDEQTRTSKGTGLGLFIVKNLLNLMKAEIAVKDNQPKGAIFEITFKKYHAI